MNPAGHPQHLPVLPQQLQARCASHAGLRAIVLARIMAAAAVPGSPGCSGILASHFLSSGSRRNRIARAAPAALDDEVRRGRRRFELRRQGRRGRTRRAETALSSLPGRQVGGGRAMGGAAGGAGGAGVPGLARGPEWQTGYYRAAALSGGEDQTLHSPWPGWSPPHLRGRGELGLPPSIEGDADFPSQGESPRDPPPAKPKLRSPNRPA